MTIERTTVEVRYVGGSTALLKLGGLQFVIDPTFDPPPPPVTDGPHRVVHAAMTLDQVPPIDVALVSHDQHPDNLDVSGRELLTRSDTVVTTPAAAGRLANGACGLAPYESAELSRPDGGRLRVTAMPALHGPIGAETTLGPVTGFRLTADDLPSVYISGDNASLDIVREIAQRTGPTQIAILFCGAASIPDYFDGAPLTMPSQDAADAAGILGARVVVPVHCDGWSHYSEPGDALTTAFADAGRADVLRRLRPGETAHL